MSILLFFEYCLYMVHSFTSLLTKFHKYMLKYKRNGLCQCGGCCAHTRRNAVAALNIVSGNQ